MTITAADVLADPADTDGTPVGVGDWRLTVQVWLPSHASSVVGVAVVGTDVVAVDEWTDLADYVTGVDIVDGAAEWQTHPSPSVCSFTLRSPDHRFAPWAAYGTAGSGSRFVTGTPCRVVLFDPVADEVHPLFTGEIETATESTAGADTVATCTVIAVDTVSARLGRDQLVQYTVDAGATGQACEDFTDELLTHVGWPYGTLQDIQIDDSNDPYFVGGELLVNGTAAEILRRMADALGRRFGADRYGRCTIVRHNPQLTTYTNAYTPAADPNVPATVTLDTATDDVIADSCTPTFAGDAIVNDVEYENLIQSGIYTPATVGAGTSADRLATSINSTTTTGLKSGSTNTVVTPWDSLFRYINAEASDAASIARYGRRSIAAADLFPIWFGKFVGDQITTELVDGRACSTSRDLWRVPLELDEREVAVIAAARVGAPAVIDHAGATYTGVVGAINIRSTPLKNSCRVHAELVVNAYSIERPTP